MNESVANNTWEWCKDVMMSWLEDPGVEEFEGLNMTALNMDQAYVVGEVDRDVGVYTVSDDCFRCPFELHKTLKAGSEQSWVTSTARRSTWRIYTSGDEKYISVQNTSGMLCQLRPDIGQFGVYRLNVSDGACGITTTKGPVDIYKLKCHNLSYSLDTFWLPLQQRYYIFGYLPLLIYNLYIDSIQIDCLWH